MTATHGEKFFGHVQRLAKRIAQHR
jgi:hypothetical protein